MDTIVRTVTTSDGTTSNVGHVFHDTKASGIGGSTDREKDVAPHAQRIIWKNVFRMTVIHAISVYSLLRISQFKVFTLVFSLACYALSVQGITAGAHRLWAHRAYKAKLPLKIVLMLLNSIALQNSIFDWARDHRTHHKYSDTDADPHNSKNGFFFCHMGWLMFRKHPDVARKGATIPLDDLKNDPVVAFQRRYYGPLALTFCFFIPTFIPWYVGEETMWNAFCATVLRYCFTLHVTWTVNSFAHTFGQKPYDKNIRPSENTVVNGVTLGEGYHNYHHTFPYDYAASEFGMKINLTTALIDLMAYFGLAYGRRLTTKDSITARKRRTGEVSRSMQSTDHHL